MGSSETDVKELAVIPNTWPGSCSTVITVIPVVNWPKALRNSLVLSAVVVIAEVPEDTTLGAAKRSPLEALSRSVSEYAVIRANIRKRRLSTEASSTNKGHYAYI